MVEARRLDIGPCRLFLKLESQNPGGSIKDRIALTMIDAAEKQGLKRGALLVEATAGNTGLGLALVGAQKGYRVLIVVPDKMSQEKIFHLRALGAEVVMTRSDVTKGHPDYYQDKAARIAADHPEILPPPHHFDDAAWVGARYAEVLPIPLDARQALLELTDWSSRLEIIQRFLRQRGVLSGKA